MDTWRKELTGAEIALLAITRVALGVGIGLLLSQRLTEERRAAAGWALVSVGVATTIPLAIDVLGKSAPAKDD
jgi:hypothetical protein